MNNSNVIVLSLAVLVLVACERSPEETKPAGDAREFWSCDGYEFALQRGDDTLALTLGGREVELAAVGERRFARNEIALEFTADDALRLTVGLEDHACTPKTWDGPWQRAQEAGVAFRAVGQEPGWFVEVTPGGDLVAVLDYGERTITLPAPEVTPLDGGARGYQAEGDGRIVQLIIEPLTCFDGMSGHIHPETVTLAVDGQRYQGCGVPLDE
jgi:putative lipoprotein